MKRENLPASTQNYSSGVPRIATLLLAALLSCVGTVAFANDFTAVNDDGVTIYYNYINDNKEAEVTYPSWDGSYSGTVTIPATVTVGETTLNVTSIGESAFRYCTSLTSVSIPSSVTSIGDNAFLRCSRLTSITIPSSVTSIGDNALYGCSGLTFITIPSSVTSIGKYAFYDCSRLTSITIPGSVTSIGESAFRYCTGLTEVTLQGSTLPTCDEEAFRNVTLTAATLYCAPGLEISCSNTKPWSSFGSIYTLVTLADGERLSKYITDSNKGTVTKLKIYGKINSDDITLMAEMAKNGALSVIDMSEATAATASLIGANAFWACVKLTSISLPESITSVGSYAFSGCSSLTSITIPNTVTSIGWYVFSDCSSLTSIDIPDGVAKIDSYTFSNCSSLVSVTIPNSVTIISNGVFSNCSSLTSVTIGSSVTSIGSYAFAICSSLAEVILLGSTLPNFGSYVFENINLSKATLYCAPGLETSCSTNQPWSSFGSIYTLVTLASGERLSNYITEDNKSTVTKLKIYGEVNSEDITLMKEMATSGALSVIDMSEATAAIADLIGVYAFAECRKLTSISLPKGVTSIGEGAFWSCSSLTSVTIPGSVTSIGNNAFYSCSKLTSNNIPNSVTSIGSSAFSDCTGLTSVTIPNGVTSIGSYTFRSCSSLTSVAIGSSVKSIGYNAFYGCTSLTSVTIPNSVTSIGNGAFSDCTGLTEVTLQGKTLPECNTNAFSNIDLTKATLYCKAALLEKCKTTAPWENFNVVAKSFSITIFDACIATGCFDDDLDFSKVADVKAYIVSAFSPTEGKVLLTRATKIPAETGFVVKGAANTYEIPAAATDYVYSNMLVGILEATTVETTDGTYTNYVLGKGSDGVAGFYLANGDAVPANKAYLRIPTSAVTTDEDSEAKTVLSLSFDDTDDTTGIIQTREQSERTSDKAVIYNLNGQRKQSLTKGLNIVNGKKIFVK